MKAGIVIAVLGLIGWGGYLYLDDLMAQERFGTAVEQAIDDPRTTTPDDIRLNIQAAAQREGMTVDPEAIELSVAASGVQPVAGQMVAGAGMAVTSQRLTVRIPYERTVWGRPQHRMLERARVYVASAAPGVNTQDHALSALPEKP
jgi:hypothetical protein